MCCIISRPTSAAAAITIAFIDADRKQRHVPEVGRNDVIAGRDKETEAIKRRQHGHIYISD